MFTTVTVRCSRRRTEEWKREAQRTAATKFNPVSRLRYRRHVQLDVLQSVALSVYSICVYFVDDYYRARLKVHAHV